MALDGKKLQLDVTSKKVSMKTVFGVLDVPARHHSFTGRLCWSMFGSKRLGGLRWLKLFLVQIETHKANTDPEQNDMQITSEL